MIARRCPTCGQCLAQRTAVREQCDALGLPYERYRSRLRKGYTHEQALTGKGVRRPGAPSRAK